MNSWAYLVAAIITEVSATLALRTAARRSKSRRLPWFVGVGCGYTIAFTCLAGALRAGMPVGIAYGVWAASGVALTAIAARIIFKDPLNVVMCAGISLIAGGVLLIEFGASH
ncbi:MAG: DMT family transporter [Rhodococcus sp. (in: high G+C Gram-positive bacteria)]